MILEKYVRLPYTSGEIVTKYLQVLDADVEYDAWTIDDSLEIVKCKGIIKNNESWNYHNNYDDSKEELYVKISGQAVSKRWFTLNLKEAVEVLKPMLTEWKNLLEIELERVKALEGYK